jgi:hypothetical protein
MLGQRGNRKSKCSKALSWHLLANVPKGGSNTECLGVESRGPWWPGGFLLYTWKVLRPPPWEGSLGLGPDL